MAASISFPISTTPPEPPATIVVRGESFEVEITGSVESGPPGPIREVVRVEGVARAPEDTVEVIDGPKSVIIQGQYFDAWADEFTFVPAGESDKTAEPETVTFLSNLPEAQNLFSLNQDLSDTKTRLYDITVTYTENNEEISETFLFTHTIEQDFDAIKELMANYKYNGTGAL